MGFLDKEKKKVAREKRERVARTAADLDLPESDPPGMCFDGSQVMMRTEEIVAKVRAMSDAKIVAEMQRDTYLNRARKKFSHACAGIEQANAQRQRPTSVELRRMEFEAVLEIAAVLGVKLL